MKRVYFTLTLMSLFGGLNAFASVTNGGVVYDKMPDGKCLVVNFDEKSMPADGIVTIAKTVNIDGTDCTVSGILGSEDYTKEDNYYDNGKTSYDRAAFADCKTIKGLRFAEGSGVTWIGDHAFRFCSNLKTIENIPSGLKEIKGWCFEGTALETVDLSNTNVTIMKDGVFYNNKSLTSIQLPNKLENFWDNAFNGCTSLNNIDMPSTVVGIYNNVFNGCTSLYNVKLNEGCTTLGDHVFKGCPLTSSFKFPSSLSSISVYAFEGAQFTSADLSNTQIEYLPTGCFYNCDKLKDVKLPSTLKTPNNGDWKKEDDAKYGKSAFQKTAIESIDLTNTQLISLGDYMFANCEKLKTVKLPHTLKFIWNHAFCNSHLSSITLSSLLRIENYAFQNTQLTDVVIPTSTSHIGEGAFCDNANLTTVVVNGRECYLAWKAFCNCSKLTDVYITSDKEPVAGRYGGPFDNNPKVHVVPNYLETFKGLRNDKNENPCNTTNFVSDDLSIKLNKEWTTFSSAYNLDFSGVEGLTAYTGKYNNANNDAVALTQVKKAPAKTGLILKGEASKTYTVPILASNEAGLEAVTDNQLVDCVDALWSTGRENDYFLHNGEFVKSTNNGWVLPGKSYLYIEGGRHTNNSESPLRVYVDNTATAINGITNNPVVKDEAYYNLQGVKVQRPQHGVFIHNGKKVVLK